MRDTQSLHKYLHVHRDPIQGVGLQDKEPRLYFQLTLKQAAEFFGLLKQMPTVLT